MSETWPEVTRRRFGLLDGMILVSAAAAGFAWLRATSALPGGLIHSGPMMPLSEWAPSLIRLKDRLRHALGLVAPFTLAVPILALRRPRPPWGELTTRPGFVACLAAFAGFMIRYADRFAELATYPGESGAFEMWLVEIRFLTDPGPVPALAIALSWLTLALGGRWNADRGWIDRLGRVVGLAWILILLTLRILDRALSTMGFV